MAKNPAAMRHEIAEFFALLSLKLKFHDEGKGRRLWSATEEEILREWPKPHLVVHENEACKRR